jgi:hypothetical protein
MDDSFFFSFHQTNNHRFCAKESLKDTNANKITMSSPIMPKQVHFLNLVEVAEVPNSSEFSADQRRCMWYNATELRIMKKQKKRIARMVDLGFNYEYDGERYCTVGIYSREHCRQRYSQMKESFVIVFIEQGLQWEEEENFPETIAQVYAESTQHVVLDAQERAFCLAEEVRTGFVPEFSPEVTTATTSSKKPRVALVDVEFRRWDMSGEQGSRILGRKQRGFSLSSRGPIDGLLPEETAPVE